MAHGKWQAPGGTPALSPSACDMALGKATEAGVGRRQSNSLRWRWWSLPSWTGACGPSLAGEQFHREEAETMYSGETGQGGQGTQQQDGRCWGRCGGCRGRGKVRRWLVRRAGLPVCSDRASMSLMDATAGGAFPWVGSSQLPCSLLSSHVSPWQCGSRHQLGPLLQCSLLAPYLSELSYAEYSLHFQLLWCPRSNPP